MATAHVGLAGAGALGPTLVIYMGLRNLKKIVSELAAAGMDPRTPACLIENGTLGTQRQVVTRLGALSTAGFRGRR